MSVVADYPDYSPHYAHAQQIAATGVPLLHKAAQLAAGTGVIISPSGTVASPVVPVTQTGYHGSFLVQFAGGSANPFVEVQLIWIDAITGVTVGIEAYVLPGSAPVNFFPVRASGLVKGDKVQVKVLNLDIANSATLTYFLNQDSIPRSHDRWGWDNTQIAGVVVPGFSLATMPDDESVLGVLNAVTVPAAGNKGFLFGMAAGQPVMLTGITSGITPASVQLIAAAVPQSTYTAGGQLLNATLTTAGFSFQFIAPHSPVFLQLANNATSGTLTVSGMMTAQAA